MCAPGLPSDAQGCGKETTAGASGCPWQQHCVPPPSRPPCNGRPTSCSSAPSPCCTGSGFGPRDVPGSGGASEQGVPGQAAAPVSAPRPPPPPWAAIVPWFPTSTKNKGMFVQLKAPSPSGSTWPGDTLWGTVQAGGCAASPAGGRGNLHTPWLSLGRHLCVWGGGSVGAGGPGCAAGYDGVCVRPPGWCQHGTQHLCCPPGACC